MAKDKHDKSRTSQDLQQEYAKVCTQLGQAIFAEAAAIKQQEELKERQQDLNDAFVAASQREHEEAAQQAKAAANTKAFEDKGQSNGASETNTQTP